MSQNIVFFVNISIFKNQNFDLWVKMSQHFDFKGQTESNYWFFRQYLNFQSQNFDKWVKMSRQLGSKPKNGFKSGD